MPRYVISPEVEAAALRVAGISPVTALADGGSGYQCAVCDQPGDPERVSTAVLFVDDHRGSGLVLAHAACALSRVTTFAELALDRERAGVQASAGAEPPPLEPGWWARQRHPALFLDDQGHAVENRDGTVINVLAEAMVRHGFSRPDPAVVPPRTRTGFTVGLAGSTVAAISDGRHVLWEPGSGEPRRLPGSWVRAARREGTVVLVTGDLGFPVSGPTDPDALSVDRIRTRAVCGLLPVRLSGVSRPGGHALLVCLPAELQPGAAGQDPAHHDHPVRAEHGAISRLGRNCRVTIGW